MPDAIQNEPGPASGRVWLLADKPREPEIVFAFPFDDELNEAVKRLPGRWFDWRRRHWRIPADPRSPSRWRAFSRASRASSPLLRCSPG